MSSRMLRASLLAVAIIMLGPATSGAAPPAAPIVIGATFSGSGRYFETSEMMRKGLELWRDQVNRRGGLLGRRVEFIFRDDQSDATRVGPLYESLITDNDVDLIIAPYGTPLTLEAVTVAERHDMVLMVPGASGAEIWEQGYANVFGMYALADRYFIGLFDILARAGYTRAGLIYERSAFHETVREGVLEWSARMGVDLVFDEGFSPGNPDLQPIIDRAARAGIQALIISAYVPEDYAALSLIDRAGVAPAVLALPIVAVHPDFYERAGPIAEGVIAPSQWEPIERIPYPGTASFISSFERAYGGEPSYHAASAFAACRILERAVESVGSLDQEQLARYIRTLDTVTEFGRFKVDADGRQIGHNPILIQWQDGEKRIIYPRSMQTSRPRIP